MIVDSVATAKGAPPVPPAQVWQVSAATGTPARQVFQTVLYLRFAADDFTGSFEVDEQSTVLEGAFKPHVYDALHPDVPSLAAQVTSLGDKLLVGLDGPREVTRVDALPGYSVELYRVDGRKPAVESTVGSSSGVIGSPGFTDIAFAAQLKLAGSAKDPLAVSDFAHIILKSYPTGPRIGIADTSLLQVNFFFQADGEVGKTTPASSGSLAGCGPTLAKAVFGALTSVWEALKKGGTALPGNVDLALVIQSDAPCELEITRLQVAYHRVLAGGEKQFLRFSGDRVRRQEVAIVLPGKPAIVSASVRALESLQPESAPKSATDGNGPFTDTEITSKQGLRLADADGRCAAQTFTPEAAISSKRFLLGLVSLEPGSEAMVDVRLDDAGVPSSSVLCSTKLPLPESARAYWIAAEFAREVTLPAEAHWLVVRAGKGSLIWLTEPAADSVRLGILKDSRWESAATVDGVKALFRAMSAVPLPSESAGSQLTSPLAPKSAPWVMFVDQVKVEGTRAADSSISFDLTAALNAFVQSSIAAQTLQTHLVVTSAAKGGITLYAPHIVYDAA